MEVALHDEKYTYYKSSHVFVFSVKLWESYTEQIGQNVFWQSVAKCPIV